MGNRSSSSSGSGASSGTTGTTGSAATPTNTTVCFVNADTSGDDNSFQLVDPSTGDWNDVTDQKKTGRAITITMQVAGVYGMAAGKNDNQGTPFVIYAWTIDQPTEFLYFEENRVRNFLAETNGVRMITINNCTDNTIELQIAANGAIQPTGFMIGNTSPVTVGFMVGSIIAFDGADAPREKNDIYTIGAADTQLFVNSDSLGGINTTSCQGQVNIPTDTANFIQRYRWVIILIVVGIILFIILIVFFKARSGSRDEGGENGDQGGDEKEEDKRDEGEGRDEGDEPLPDNPFAEEGGGAAEGEAEEAAEAAL